LTTTARWYVLRTEWNIHYMSQDREWNIYYMSEITKIWAEIRSSLNIWSWIERVCLNDKNSESASMTHSIVSLLQRHELTRLIRSESATKTDNDWSRRWTRHLKWVCYNDKSIVDFLIELIIEQNKLYYMRVVDMNQKTTIDLIDWARHSIVSLLQWHQISRRNRLETSDEMSLKRFMSRRNRLETSDEMSLKRSMKWAWNAQIER